MAKFRKPGLWHLRSALCGISRQPILPRLERSNRAGIDAGTGHPARRHGFRDRRILFGFRGGATTYRRGAGPLWPTPDDVRIIPDRGCWFRGVRHRGRCVGTRHRPRPHGPRLCCRPYGISRRSLALVPARQVRPAELTPLYAGRDRLSSGNDTIGLDYRRDRLAQCLLDDGGRHGGPGVTSICRRPGQTFFG